MNPFDLPDEVIDAVTARWSEVSPAERGHVVQEVAARFPAWAERLRDFARAVGDADQVLDATFGSSSGAGAAPQALPRFEGYRIVRPLGEGAFGVVYLCEQNVPMQRQVAIKLLRPGAGDRSTLLRFESERRFLARLQHPAIAQIFDVGALPDGRPWFVMEHIDGVPLVAFCDRAQMAIAARLRLFVRLCHGVQHAHEHGIVHRDLKPSNVLVVAIDGEPQPKIIDFGIARSMQMGGKDDARTETGRIVGTPGYMSPEQAEGRLHEVDERSDVWSLGAMLFELLTGTLPYGKQPRSTTTEPVRPSQRLAAEPARLPELAGQRGTDGRRLSASVRGDLDWIVSRALARERDRRYASVRELAADVLRHLAGEPVHAGPPSLGYRLRKFARRYRAGIAVAAIAVLMLGFGAWWLLSLQTRAAVQAAQAEAAVKALLVRANDPELARLARGASVRRTLVEDAMHFYDRWLRERPDDPAARSAFACCLSTLSQVHWMLGNTLEAQSAARDAIATYDELLAAAPDDAELCKQAGIACSRLGRALADHGANRESIAPLQRAVALLERALAIAPKGATPHLVDALGILAAALEPAAAVAVLERATSLQRATCAAAGEDAAEHDLLGLLVVEQARNAIARRDPQATTTFLRQAEALGAQQAFGFETRLRLHHARTDFELRMRGAEAACAEAELYVATAREWVAKEPDRMHAHGNLAMALRTMASLQRSAGASWEPTAAAAVAAAARLVDDYPGSTVARSYYQKAVTLVCDGARATGRRDELAAPLELARRSVALFAPSPDLPETARRREAWLAQGQLGMLADALELADGDAIWAECAATIAQIRPPLLASPFAIEVGNRIARRLLLAGRVAEAEPWLARVEAWQAAGDPPRRRTGVATTTARLRIDAAVQRGDLAAAERIANELAASPSDWQGAIGVAEAMSAVWSAASKAKRESVAALRDRALQLGEAAANALAPFVEGDPESPWFREPHLRLAIRRALLLADAGTGVDRESLSDALREYASLQHLAHANEWSESVLTAGRELLSR